MAESAEIPEAKDPFERRIALSIAIMAVVLSLLANRGEDAKTEAILKTNESTDKWGEYQSQSIKGHLAEVEIDLLNFSANRNSEEVKQKVTELESEVSRRKVEKGKIKAEAEDLSKEAKAKNIVNSRCDYAVLFLQVAVVLASVAILCRWHAIWFVGIALSLVGAMFGIYSAL